MKGARAIAAGQGFGNGSGGGHLNVTPLIDIVMVLIIFFLLVGQLAMDRQGDVELPEAVSGEPTTPENTPIAIAVEANGRLVIDGRTTQPGSLRAVLDVLLRQRPGSPVQIRADRGASYGSVRTVLDTAREAGVTDVELATTASVGALSGDRGGSGTGSGAGPGERTTP